MTQRFCRFLLIIILYVICITTVYSQEAVIAVLAPSGPEKAQKMWQPTIDYLNQQIPWYRFELLPVTKKQLTNAVSLKKVDFFLTHTGHYVELEALYGSTRILTLKKTWKKQTYSQWGSTLVASADNDEINSIDDIKNKRIAGVYKGAFGGYQVALRELSERGIVKEKDQKNILFTGLPHSSPLLAVQDGRADIGIIPTGVLEEGIESGNYLEDEFKVINAQQYNHFPFQISTRLYPYWPLAKARHASEELAELIVAALLKIPGDHPSLKAGRISGWTVPLEYSSVHELMKSIKAGPYKNYGEITFKQLIQQYWLWLLAIILAFIGGLTIILYIAHLNTRLKHTRLNLEEKVSLIESYTKELEQQKEELSTTLSTLEQTQELLIESEKMAALGNLVAGVAHEVNTPIGIAITSSTLVADETREMIKTVDNNQLTESALREYLQNVATLSHVIFTSMEKGAKLIRSFKQVAVDQHVEEKRHFVLRDYCDAVITSLKTQFNENDIRIFNNIDSKIEINSYAGIFSQIFTNLINNSLSHAFDKEGNITISGSIEDDKLNIIYMDDGKGIETELLKKIFEPFFTTNREKGGSGLGLHLIYNLIHHKLNGYISCEPQGVDNKIKFIITIPLTELSE